MTEKEQNSGIHPRLIAALVVTLFVGPILLAWWLAVARPSMTEGALLNRGTLLVPPLDLQREQPLRPLQDIPLAPGEWAIIYFTAAACAEQCVQTLGRLQVIHDVLGHDSTRVRIAALFDVDSPSSSWWMLASPAARSHLAGSIVERTATTAPEQGIVFLDWRGQIMMFYAADTESAHIKKDLKRLLRGSKIK